MSSVLASLIKPALRLDLEVGDKAGLSVGETQSHRQPTSSLLFICSAID
jgi:hypothetical protein